MLMIWMTFGLDCDGNWDLKQVEFGSGSINELLQIPDGD
jgi:hypothetical protein